MVYDVGGGGSVAAARAGGAAAAFSAFNCGLLQSQKLCVHECKCHLNILSQKVLFESNLVLLRRGPWSCKSA